MSAIWGVIEKKNEIPTETVSKMRSSMQEFKIDRYDEKLMGNIYFACGHQYFTKEAERDISPYYDEEKDILFVADCFLINRKELIQALVQETGETSSKELESLGDARLSYEAYRCWGECFVERLRGSFSMAVYDRAKETLVLYTDHVAQRYLAYYSDEKGICFSTLYQPLLCYLGEERIQLCEEWIAAAYTNCSPDTFVIPGRTVYQNVFHVEPGHYVRIHTGTNQVEHITYWNPGKEKVRTPRMDDRDYRKLFLAKFESVVSGMLRAKGQTGIKLSGGLDSSAVAAMASLQLDKEGKKLYSYTSVPAEDFAYQNSAVYIENETELVLAQQKMHPNIEPRFVPVSEENCFTNLKDYAKVFREPVKPALNMVNIAGMMQEAAKDGCSILLSGQNGNATISYGGILTYMYQKCLRGHFLSAYREGKAFAKRFGISRKKVLRVFLKALKEKYLEPATFGTDCLVKEELIKQYGLLERERKVSKERGTGWIDSEKQRRGFCFMPVVFQHMGFYDTYLSLQYGMLPLDPTLTKEMIEFCINLPIDCYVRDGKERRMVRDYMEGYIPQEILENYTGRGVQGADFAYRVNRDWDKLKEEVYDLLKEPMLRKYLEEDKLQALVEEAKEKEYKMEKNIVARITVISSLACFLRITGGDR